MSTKQYTFVRTDKELRSIADEMREYAAKNPLTKHGVETLMVNEPGQKERVGPMVRFHGKDEGVLASKYSRFIFLSTEDPRPLQICYLEYETKRGRLSQLTVSNNVKNPVLPRDVARIAHFFLKAKERVHSLETPPHVALMIQGNMGLSEEPDNEVQ